MILKIFMICMIIMIFKIFKMIRESQIILKEILDVEGIPAVF